MRRLLDCSGRKNGRTRTKTQSNGVLENLRRNTALHDRGDYQGRARADHHHAPGDHSPLKAYTFSQTASRPTRFFLQFGGGPYILRQQRELVPEPRVEQKSAESVHSAQGLSICALSRDYAAFATLRSDLKPARTSSERSWGCSHAAK